MRQIFNSFQEAHDFGQAESKKQKQPLTLCKFIIDGVKYSVIDEKEKTVSGETHLHKYNEKGEIE